MSKQQMNETQILFENAKVGDDVLCARRGRVKIIRINRNSYPIVTSGEYSYTLCGRSSVDDAQPILWPADKVPQYFLEVFPRPKRKVKKTIERWTNVYPTGMTCPYYASYLLYDSQELAKSWADFNDAIQVPVPIEYEVEE